MRETIKKKVRVIHAENAKEFETALNEILEEIAKPELTFDRNLPFLAYVTFDESFLIPESIADGYELRGEIHRCCECPYYHSPKDRRRKNVVCDIGERVHGNRQACELFYKMLNDGEIKGGDRDL